MLPARFKFINNGINPDALKAGLIYLLTSLLAFQNKNVDCLLILELKINK